MSILKQVWAMFLRALSAVGSRESALRRNLRRGAQLTYFHSDEVE
jgi:hypothetical protein